MECVEERRQWNQDIYLIEMFDENEKTSPKSSVGSFLRRSLRRHTDGGSLRSSLRRTATATLGFDSTADLRRSLRSDSKKRYEPKKKSNDVCNEFNYKAFNKKNDCNQSIKFNSLSYIEILY